MANVIKSVTAYPANGFDFNTIYTAPAGNGAVIQSIIEGYSGLNISNRTGPVNTNNYSIGNQEATVGIKRAGKNQLDIISGIGITTNTLNKKNASIISQKLILNPGDSIVANCVGNSPLRPIFNPKRIVADQTDQIDRNNIPCGLFLANTDGSIIICYSQGVIFRSTDRGRTWVRKVIHASTSISGFGMFFKGEFFLYTTLNNGVAYRSTDGDIWTLFSASGVNTFLYNNIVPGGITVDGTTAAYVSTTGLFSKTTDGVTWTNVTVSENTSGSCAVFAGPDKYAVIKSNDSSTPIKMYYKSNGTLHNSYGWGSATTVNKVFRIGDLIFVIFNHGSGTNLLYFSIDGTTIPYTTLLTAQTYAVFIPLKDAFIWRNGNSYILQRIINGVYFDEPIELNTSLFIDALTGSHLFDTPANGIQRYANTTLGPILVTTKGMIFDTVDDLNSACFGTSLTVSVIET